MERIEGSRARLESSLNLEAPDRIPITLGLNPVWSNWYFRKKYGVKIGEFWRDPKLLVEYQIRAWIDSFEDFDDDRTFVLPGEIGPLGGVVLHPTIAGCRAVFPEDDFAWINLQYRAFDTKDKIDAFVTPEISEAGLMPETLERLEAIERLVGDRFDVRIQGGDGCPLQMSAYTRGIHHFIRDMYTDPPIVDRLMGKMMDVYDKIQVFYRDRWGVRYEGKDIEGCFYDNPLSYFSPRLVERFVLPHYRRYARKCGWRHWSFETQDVMDPFIDLFDETPIRTINNLVSSSDLAKFRETLRPKGVRFRIFLAPGRLVHPRSIEAEVKRIISIMGRDGGWVLSSGVLDSAVSKENIRALLDATRKHGACCG